MALSSSCSRPQSQSTPLDPEPVEFVRIDVDSDNGTATVEWRPAVDPQHILTYQLSYEAVTKSDECGGAEPFVLYLSAVSSILL